MDYVLVFPYCPYRFVDDVAIMLIRKAKPEFQRGKLNLVGGKVEPGESMFAAAEREFREETGLQCNNTIRVGTIRSKNSDFVIGVYTTEAVDGEIVSEPDEPVDWYDWYDVKDDDTLMENLRTAIPLILSGMRGWELSHWTDESGLPVCSIEWSLTSCRPTNKSLT